MHRRRPHYIETTSQCKRGSARRNQVSAAGKGVYLRRTPSRTTTGAPRDSPSTSAARPSATAISITPNEFTKAKATPGRQSP